MPEMPTIRQDGRMQARLAYPSEYLVGQVREYLLKTSEQARRLGTCYSKSGPRRPQRLSSKCPGDTNCDSQIAERPDTNLPPTTRTTIQRRTQSVLPAAASRRETKLAAKTRYPRAARWAPSWAVRRAARASTRHTAQLMMPRLSLLGASWAPLQIPSAT